jgi:hypothetical protein
LVQTFQGIGCANAIKLLETVVDHGDRTIINAQQSREKLAELLPENEGCINVEVGGGVAHVTLELCSIPHDTDAALRPLKEKLPSEAYGDFLKKLSMMFYFTQQMYRRIIREDYVLASFLTAPLDAEDRSACVGGPFVDKDTSTLYVQEAWPQRLGITVRM